MMEEACRVLEAAGPLLHSVDKRQWRWWNNDLLYQNRLRPVDFVTAAREAGAGVLLDLQTPRTELMARFEEMAVAPEFRHDSQEPLCCTSANFAARPERDALAAALPQP